MTTPNSREEMRVKIINILSYQAGITAQGISYTGEKDWALNKLTELLHQELQKAREEKDKEKEEAVAAAEKAYGGCHYCYGKGYGTQTAAWEGRGYYKKLPTMKFCTCERGEQLKSLLTTPLPDQGGSK